VSSSELDWVESIEKAAFKLLASPEDLAQQEISRHGRHSKYFGVPVSLKDLLLISSKKNSTFYCQQI